MSARAAAAPCALTRQPRLFLPVHLRARLRVTSNLQTHCFRKEKNTPRAPRIAKKQRNPTPEARARVVRATHTPNHGPVDAD
jgi:hypothetical protein